MRLRTLIGLLALTLAVGLAGGGALVVAERALVPDPVPLAAAGDTSSVPTESARMDAPKLVAPVSRIRGAERDSERGDATSEPDTTEPEHCFFAAAKHERAEEAAGC